MGASIATNTANEIVNVSTAIVNTYSQSCSSSSTASQILKISGCSGVIVDNVNQSLYTYISAACLQNDTTQSSIDTTIKQAAKQAAESVTQNFGMPSLSVSANISNEITNLAYNVSNAYTSNCIESIAATQDISCTDSKNVIISGVAQTETAAQISSCILKTSTVNSVKSDLQQLISQTAVAKEENALNFIGGILAILLIIPLIAFAQKSKSQSKSE